jgi:hypothetical protein
MLRSPALSPNSVFCATGTIFPNGASAGYAYDQLSRLRAINNQTSVKATISHFACTRDDVGTIVEKVRDGGSSAQVQLSLQSYLFLCCPGGMIPKQDYFSPIIDFIELFLYNTTLLFNFT